MAVKSSLLALILLVLGSALVLHAQDLDAIRAKLNSGNNELVRSALFEIRDLRSAEASRLAIPLLSDRDEVVRATAIGSVQFLPQAEAASVLLPSLNNKSAFIRQEAAFVLGEVGETSAVQPLIARLNDDKDPSVRSAAAFALGKIGDPSAVAALMGVFRSKPSEDNEFLRRSAAKSIGQIAEAVNGGTSHGTTPQNFLPSKFKDPPRSLAQSLPFIFDNAARILQKVLQDKREVDDTRREAAFALGAIGDAASIPVLQRYVHSPDNYLAEICKEGLIKLGVLQ